MIPYVHCLRRQAKERTMDYAVIAGFEELGDEQNLQSYILRDLKTEVLSLNVNLIHIYLSIIVHKC